MTQEQGVDYGMTKLSSESRYEIKQILLTKAGEDGSLSVDELGDCFDLMGIDCDDEDIDFLKYHMDDNGDGNLEVDELIDNLDVLTFHGFYGKELMREFQRVDTDHDGFIRFPEFLAHLTTRGPEPLKVEPARRLLDKLARQFDENFDGKFSYAEFVKIYMSDLLPYKKYLEETGSFPDDPDDDQEVHPPARVQQKPKRKPLKKKGASFDDGHLQLPGAKSDPRRKSHTGASVEARPKSPYRRSTTISSSTKSSSEVRAKVVRRSASHTYGDDPPANGSGLRPKSVRRNTGASVNSTGHYGESGTGRRLVNSSSPQDNTDSPHKKKVTRRGSKTHLHSDHY